MAANIHDSDTRRFGRILGYGGVLLTVLGGTLAYSLLYAPMVRATADYRADIRRVKDKLKRAPEIRAQHTQLAARLADFNEQITTLRQRIPGAADEYGFLAQVTEIAEKEGVRVWISTADQPKPKDQYSQITTSLKCTTSYASLCRFLDRVRKLPRLSKITDLNIKTEMPGQQEYPVNLTFLIYFDLNVAEPKVGEEGEVEDA